MEFFNSLPQGTQDIIKDWGPSVASLFGKLLYAAVILMVGRWIGKKLEGVTRQLLNKARVDEMLSQFLSVLVYYSVLAATIIAALEKVGIRTASLLAVFASAGLAIGLALQGSLSNFAAGTMLLFFRPFQAGDKVDAGGKVGRVESIGLFTTSLITDNNEVVIVPNSAITGNCITNFTAKESRRGEVDIGVAYGEDVRKVAELLEKSAKKNSKAVAEPPPGVYLAEFGASSVNFKVRAFVKPADYWAMLHELRVQVYEDLNEAGVEIPFDQIVVHQAPTD